MPKLGLHRKSNQGFVPPDSIKDQEKVRGKDAEKVLPETKLFKLFELRMNFSGKEILRLGIAQIQVNDFVR